MHGNTLLASQHAIL